MEEYTVTVTRARKYARAAHTNQKYNNLPYFAHVESVANMVALIDPENIFAIAAAYLHDVVEDTSIIIEELSIDFDDPIIEIVNLCTDPIAPNRKQRKALTNKRFSETNNISACLVKLCDRFDNVSKNKITGNINHLKMYAKEHSEFRKAVYRDDKLLQPIQTTLDNLIWNK